MTSLVARPAEAGLAPRDRLAANTAWMCARSVARLILVSAYFVAVARGLGAAGYGEFMTVAALAAMLAPFGGLGSGNLLVRDVSREPAALPERWSTALVTTALSGLLLTAVLVVVASYALAGVPLVLVALVGLADLVFAQFADVCGKAFQAEQRLDLTASLDTFLSVAKLAAAVALWVLITEPTPVIWAACYATANVLAAAVSVGAIYARHRRLPLRLTISGRATREGFYFSLSLWAQAVQRDIDKMLIVRLAGPQAAGIYTAASRIAEMAFTPVHSLLAATYPGFFRHGAAGLRGAMAFARPLVVVGGLYGLVAALGLALAAPMLPLVLGEEYAGAVESLRWLALLPLLKALHYVAGDVLTGAGFQRLRSGLQLLVGAAGVGLAMWAIPLYAWRGAAGAAIAANVLLVVASWAAIAVMRRSPCAR
jgi:O-antigen/teichoic acid export membrane protein